MQCLSCCKRDTEFFRVRLFQHRLQCLYGNSCNNSRSRGLKGNPAQKYQADCGKPLIAWIIQAAKGSKYITRIIVSTDDNEIASVSKEYGAEAPFIRPKEISGDLSTDVEFLTHALKALKEKEGYEPDIILRLPPTSPLCTRAHIDEGIKTLLDDNSLDAVRPICEAPKHPYKLWKIGEDGKHLEPFLPKSFTATTSRTISRGSCSQKVYIHTGAMDVMRLDTILKHKSTSGEAARLLFYET